MYSNLSSECHLYESLAFSLIFGGFDPAHPPEILDIISFAADYDIFNPQGWATTAHR
jgi:hypothetical protein